MRLVLLYQTYFRTYLNPEHLLLPYLSIVFGSYIPSHTFGLYFTRFVTRHTDLVSTSSFVPGKELNSLGVLP